MKNPILLKLLQKSATKATLNFPNTRSRKGDKGYTIIELLIIVLILGIFASIAAPGWLGFINRQRVRTVNDRVFQTLRTAQSEAKRTKSDRVVTFNLTDPPTATINTVTVPAQNPPLQTVTFDAGGEIKAGTIKLLTNATAADTDLPLNSIIFDYQGNVKKLPSTNPAIPGRFVILVSTVDGGAKQCVIVETLLGGMRTDEGTFNPTTGQGCPVVP
ncbi:prepilin-type N-terminal cleavage/methylation domain-containing protein [Microcoleus sp. herbarium14]|uniref:pilus assembly FimT family protein n=1 Tax=Microcoleus sp. herbarium14 TaxID=3055439 RepID=UPI002FD2200D